MSSLMVWRLSGRKISASFKFVISRVLEGGVGMDRGGTFERSIDMDVRDAFEDERDKGGELSADMLWLETKPMKPKVYWKVFRGIGGEVRVAL